MDIGLCECNRGSRAARGAEMNIERRRGAVCPPSRIKSGTPPRIFEARKSERTGG
jgi:hypothetical protein